MLSHHLPELAGKTSKDASTSNKALKYVAIAVLAICTLVVSALFVKVYVLQAEPSLHNKVEPVKEEPIHKEQDPIYFVGVDIELGQPSTVAPTLKVCEPVNQENSQAKKNNLKQKPLDSHVFQSVIPATEFTNNVEIVKPIENSYIKNEDTNLTLNPFINLWPLFNFTDEEQKVNNEWLENDDNPFENFFYTLFKPKFDSEETNFGAIRPFGDQFVPSESYLNFPSFKPTFNSQEVEMFKPFDSYNTENFYDISKLFPDLLAERPESTTTSSNETGKPLESPILEIKSLDNF